jgi:hypothetical protein
MPEGVSSSARRVAAIAGDSAIGNAAVRGGTVSSCSVRHTLHLEVLRARERWAIRKCALSFRLIACRSNFMEHNLIKERIR